MYIKNLPGDNLFFTSDTHWGHDNIIKYCSRPFQNVHEMNKAMTDRWNEVVPKDGIVFHLGDLAFRGKSDFKEYIEALNGTIYITPGNHDGFKDLVNSRRFVAVDSIMDLLVLDDEMEDGNQKITCCHYPMHSWNQSHRGAWQLFGHHHQAFKSANLLQLDVGVEGHKYYPWSYTEVKDFLTKRAMKV